MQWHTWDDTNTPRGEEGPTWHRGNACGTFYSQRQTIESEQILRWCVCARVSTPCLVWLLLRATATKPSTTWYGKNHCRHSKMEFLKTFKQLTGKQERGKSKKIRRNKQKTNEMIDLNPNMSIIILNGNDSRISIKRNYQELPLWHSENKSDQYPWGRRSNP